MSKENDKESDSPKSFGKLFGEESAQITFDNMKLLCNQSEYTVEGVKYKRNILKPKQLVELFKLQNLMEKIEDPEKRMENVKAQAKVCLTIQEGKNFDTEWENTDAVYMETIVGACLMIARGFRKI